MSLRCTSLLFAALTFASAATPAMAWCGAYECYDRVRVREVYRPLIRPVVVPGYREVIETPPVVAIRPERVLVAPRRVSYAMTPPVTRTEFQEIVVRPGGYRWASTYGPYGERRCKVPVPAEIKVVPREVYVRPGRRVRVVTPPVYAVRERAVVVRPGRRVVVDHPPGVFLDRSRVIVRPATTAWVPASYGW